MLAGLPAPVWTSMTMSYYRCTEPYHFYQPHEGIDDIFAKVMQHIDGLIAKKKISLDLSLKGAEMLLSLLSRFLKGMSVADKEKVNS